MQHDSPTLPLPNRLTSAESILELAGQLASPGEMLLICTPEAVLLAANAQAKQTLFPGSTQTFSTSLINLLEGDFRDLAHRHLALLTHKRQLLGHARVRNPQEKGEPLFLAYKTKLLTYEEETYLFVSAKVAKADLAIEQDKNMPVIRNMGEIEIAEEPLLIINDKGIILDINNDALQRIGYNKKQTAGQPIGKFFDLNPSEKAALSKTLKLVRENGPQKFDWWIKTSTSQYVPVEIGLTRGKYLGRNVVVGTVRENQVAGPVAPSSPVNHKSHLSFLNLLASNLATLPDSEAIMQFALEKLIQNTEVQSGARYQYDYSKQILVLISAESAEGEPLDLPHELPLALPLVEQMVGNRSLPTSYKISSHIQQLLGRKELLAMPVNSFQELEGMLLLFVDDACQITPSLMGLADNISNEAGNAITRLNLNKGMSRSEFKYRTLFESSHDAILLVSLHEILDCNSKALELLETTKDQIIGKKAKDFFPEFQPDGQLSDDKAYNLLKQILETGESKTFEWQNLRKDGSIFECEVSLDRVWLDWGYFVQLVLRDITHRKQADRALRSEEVLRESMKHFRNFLGKVNLLYMSQDLNGNITYINDYFAKYTGYRRRELVGKNYYAVLTPQAQREKRQNAYLQMVKSQKMNAQYEREVVCKNGATKLIRWNSIFELDSQGNPVGITSVGKDMTEKQIALEALKDNKVRLQDLFDNAHDLIQNTSIDNKFIFVNRAWKEKLGYDDADIENLTLNDIVHPYYKAKLIYQLRNLYKGEMVNKIETVFMTKAGKPVHLIGSINCSFQDGKPVFTRSILHDITDRIKAERLQKVYYSIANLAISSKDLPSLYSAIHRELSKIIETNNIYIALCNDEKTELTFVYNVDQLVGKNTSFKTRAFSSGISEYVIQTGMPLFMVEKDIEDLIKQGKVKPTGHQPKVMLCSPLAVGDRIIGMIAVQDYKKEDAYVSTDIEILHFISNQIALAIERKRNEEQINKQNARLKAIFESGSHIMWALDRSEVITSSNQNFNNLYKQFIGKDPIVSHTQFKLTGNASFTLANPEEWAYRMNQAYEGDPQHFEVKIYSAHQQEMWFEIFLNPIYMEDGTFEEVSGIAQDITDKKASQLALVENEEKFRRIFESFQDVYYRINWDNTVELMSPSILDMVGYESAEVIGKPGSNLYEHPEHQQELFDMLSRQGKVRNFETTFRCKDGSNKQVLMNSRLLLDIEDNPIAIEGVARDITELKQTQNELIRAKEVAENLLQMKTQFLANMSHELRTPMNGIIGMIDLLNSTNTNEEQRDFIDTLRRSSDALLNILNDILDLSKIQAGKLVISEAGTDLHFTLEKIYSLFSNRAQHKDLQFNYQALPGTPRFILTDETRLLQILSNLTSNAIKFTNQGEVSVTVRSLGAKDEVHQLEFRVKDSGIGISEEDQKLLFTNFTQLDNSSTKTFGGTGLGLAISKQLSELLGGDIGVDSVYGQGSTFWFTIACKAADNDSEMAEQVMASRKVQAEVEQFEDTPYVLLVDDNIINQKVALKLLQKIGCRIDVASNGFEAIEQATANQYDIIFMDIQMPVMDGVTATKHIKEKLDGQCPPIVAMTAYSMKDDAEKFMNQGLDDYVSKPVKSKDLYNMILHWHKGFKNSSPEEAAEAEEEVDVIDGAVLEQLMQLGGEEFTIQLYAEFEEETEPLLLEAKKEVESKQYKSILSTLHQIKGTGSTLGLHRIADMAKKLEHDIKNEELAQIGQDFSTLLYQFDLYKTIYKAKLTIS